MNATKYQLFQSNANEKYYFNLKAGNGEIILNSQGYISKQGAYTGIESVRVNSPHDNRYDRYDSQGNYSFNLKAANGEIIGRSEMYTTAAMRNQGIESVKKNGPIAVTDDKTS